MLDLTSRTAFELHLEVEALWRTVEKLKSRIKQLEEARQPTEQPANERPRVTDILQIVCREANLSPIEILAERRDVPVVRARHVTCWLARRFTRHSQTAIARALDIDPTTVGHAERKIERHAARRCPVENTPEAWARLLLKEQPK